MVRYKLHGDGQSRHGYVCVCVVQTDTQRVKGKERRIATQKEVAVNCPCINMRIEAQLLNYVQTDVK